MPTPKPEFLYAIEIFYFKCMSHKDFSQKKSFSCSLLVPDERPLCPGHQGRAGVLGHRRAADGALLRPEVLPRDRALRQGGRRGRDIKVWNSHILLASLLFMLEIHEDYSLNRGLFIAVIDILVSLSNVLLYEYKGNFELKG